MEALITILRGVQAELMQKHGNFMDTTIDPQIKNLVSSIGEAETGTASPNKYQTKGPSGEFGRYQFMPDSWKQWSKQYLGDENAPMSMENQNKVAYSKVKEWKDAGLNPAQIASKWNSGDENAYKNNHVGVNSQGVKYDTPAYTAKVSQYYEQKKAQGGQNIAEASNGQNTSQAPQTDNKDMLQKTGDVVNTIFPGKETGQAIGTLGGLAYEKLKGLFGGQDNSKYYDTSAPTPLQVVGDIAQGALMVGSGLPEAGATTTAGRALLGGVEGLKTAGSTLGRIGQAGLLGAGFGATNAIKQGSTDLGEIGKQTAIGGATGGVLGTAGEAISKVAQTLPEWITRKFITGKGIGNDEIQYAVDKGLGSPTKMLSQSNSSIDTLGSQLGDVLTSPQYKDFTVPGRDILNKVAKDFPDAGLSRVDIIKKLQSIVPLKANLVNDLLKGELNLDELHTLNSALGKNTFKSVFDGVEVKANKEIGSAVYHTISDIIKNVAPESVPIFDSLSKEYPLNSALQGLIRRGETGKAISLKDIVALTSGFSVGGLPGAATAFGIEKLATNSTVNLKTAGLISKLVKPTAQAVGRGTRGLLTKNLSGLFGGNVNVRQ